MASLADAAAQLDSGDVSGAIRTLMFACDDAAPRELAALMGRAGQALGFDDVVEAADAVVGSPGDAVALFELGWACTDRGAPEIAVPLLRAALSAAPGNAEIVSELAASLDLADRRSEAVAVLHANSASLSDWPHRYQLALYSVLDGDVAEARVVASTLSAPEERWKQAHDSLLAMLSRAESFTTSPAVLALRSWHFVLNGGLLLHLSPFGFEEGMNGRYAFTQDSFAGVRRTIDRMRVALEAAGASPTRVMPLPDRGSRVLGLALASVLDLPVVPFGDVHAGAIVAAYDLDSVEDLSAFTEKAPASLLLEHATKWTSPRPITPDVSGFLHQIVESPWAARSAYSASGMTRVPEDTRPVDDLVAEVLDAQRSDEEIAPSDSDSELAAFVTSLGAQWPGTGRRQPFYVGGPVGSSRFL